MKTSEIRELSILEMEKKIRDTKESLLQMRMRKNTGQLEKPHEVELLRREIARLKTILAEKRAKEAAA